MTHAKSNAPAGAQDLLAAVFDASTALLAVYTPDGEIVRLNAACRRLMGHTREPVGERVWDLLLPEYEWPSLRGVIRDLKAGFASRHHQSHCLTVAGGRRLVAWNSTPVRDDAGTLTHVVSTGLDITGRKHADDYRRVTEQVFNSSDEGVLITDAENHIVEVNHAFEAITGYRRDETLGRTPKLLQSGRHGTEFYQRMWRSLQRADHWEGQIWDRRKDGALYPAWTSIGAVRDSDGEVATYVAVFRDLTQRHEMEERLRRLANYDALTELPNRNLFRDRLDQAIAHAARNDTQVSLLLIDLDNFRRLNDEIDHQAGDHLLREAAARVRHGMLESDTVARLGGDEFTVLLQGSLIGSNVVRIAETLRHELAQPYHIGGRSFRVTASIGICLYPTSADSASHLLKRADEAMHRAKDGGGNRVEVWHEDDHLGEERE